MPTPETPAIPKMMGERYRVLRELGRGGVTRQGAILGTPLYGSPEQVRCQTVGPQTDIWALGVSAYELLTGKTYWKTDSVTGLLFKVVQAPLKPPSKERAALPPADKKAAPRAAPIPKSAPPPVEQSTPLLTPQPLRGEPASEARTQKRRKKSKSPSDGARDPLSFDPAAP